MSSQVLFASRIPVDLKEKLSRFCHARGMRMNFVVSQAIREKLERLAEDEADATLLRARRKDAEFLSTKDMDGYFKKRLARKR